MTAREYCDLTDLTRLKVAERVLADVTARGPALRGKLDEARRLVRRLVEELENAVGVEDQGGRG